MTTISENYASAKQSISQFATSTKDFVSAHKKGIAIGLGATVTLTALGALAYAGKPGMDLYHAMQRPLNVVELQGHIKVFSVQPEALKVSVDDWASCGSNCADIKEKSATLLGSKYAEGDTYSIDHKRFSIVNSYQTTVFENDLMLTVNSYIATVKSYWPFGE